MEFSFFPNDAQEFFKRVAQQTIEARKKCGQVMHTSNCVTYPVIGVTYLSLVFVHWYLCIGIKIICFAEENGLPAVADGRS